MKALTLIFRKAFAVKEKLQPYCCVSKNDRKHGILKQTSELSGRILTRTSDSYTKEGPAINDSEVFLSDDSH